jgi:hypothetical protein
MSRAVRRAAYVTLMGEKRNAHGFFWESQKERSFKKTTDDNINLDTT